MTGVIAHIVDWAVVVAILYSMLVAWHLYRDFKHRSFLLALAAMVYALVIHTWLAVDTLTSRNLFPREDWATSMAGGFFILLAAGYWGFHKGLDTAKKIRYGRRKEDRKEGP